MYTNRLHLNAGKTKVTCATTYPTASGQPSFSRRLPILLVPVVQDLGVFADSNLGPTTHVRRTVSTCYVLAGTSPTTASGRWRCRSSTRHSTTATLSWSSCPPTNSGTFCRFSVRQIVGHSDFSGTKIYQTLSQCFTGFG
jgi:hypothetical protein